MSQDHALHSSLGDRVILYCKTINNQKKQQKTKYPAYYLSQAALLPGNTLCDQKGEGLGVVAHTLIPALWEAEVGGSPEVRSLRPA